MKKEYKSRLAIGLVLLLIGIALEMIGKGVYSLITNLFILFGLILIINSVLRHLKFRDEPEKDERAIKIGTFAMAYAWLVTMGVLALLVWLDYNNLVKMTAFQALMVTYSVSLLAAGVFVWYFRRKGDVE
ncbi:MAG: hypothetical protein OIN66_16855 [Candidatus Methanoperedens sp.]|nr:hypothetical protein [Candidatus Methanoperedens sp.]